MTRSIGNNCIHLENGIDYIFVQIELCIMYITVISVIPILPICSKFRRSSRSFDYPSLHRNNSWRVGFL